MMRIAVALVALGLLGCKGRDANHPAAATSRATTCGAAAADLGSFEEQLESASADAKVRVVNYAGRLELLLSFEDAAAELATELAGLSTTDREVGTKLADARAALERSVKFARQERDEVDKHVREIAPVVREAQTSWNVLRSMCERRGPVDCASIREVIGRFDAAETAEQHEHALADLAGARVTTPALLKARDRAVTAGKGIQASTRAHAGVALEMPRRWAAVQKDLAAGVGGLDAACKGQEPVAAQLVAADRPDPRQLTVLVHVKPPEGVERSLLALAKAATDDDEKALYAARAEGAFGSGFFLVRTTATGSEVLVVTNRHVVELGDRAALELADGTSLGNAEIVYSNPEHDLAVLRPAKKQNVRAGFPLARVPAKDQQTVIATGFPGLVGRPSYQTTKGYVSNESFRLDDGSGQRPLAYVQHTAPIDPGSSGGPLTDEAGRVLGVNTLKVNGRDGVGLAVPTKYVVDTLRTADLAESRQKSPPNRQKEARLACLGFVGELGAEEPRMLVLEQMISNQLVSAEGLDAAQALGSDEGFETLWNTDSVRAMRIATLVRVRNAFIAAGGPSILETCDNVEVSTARPDLAKFRIRLANFETRDLGFRWEHGRWKVDAFDTKGRSAKPATPKKLPPPGVPAGPPARKVAPPRSR